MTTLLIAISAALAVCVVVLLVLLLTAGQTIEYCQKYVATDYYPKAAAFNISIHGLTERLFKPTKYSDCV